MIKEVNIDVIDGHQQPVQNLEVVVKLKTTEASRKAFGLMEASREENVFSRLLNNNIVDNISPLFAATNRGNLEFFDGNKLGAANRAAMADFEDPALSGLNVIKFFNEQDAAASIVALSKDPNVEYAHIPSIRKFAGTTDPGQNRQWGLRAIDYFKALNVAGYKNAKSISVAILDSGIDPGHPDLQGIFSHSVNFTTLGQDDDSGHGTHVAGIIAALTNNGIGITGTCESNRLMILRGLTDPYQAVAYYNAIRFAFNNGAQVLNCSLGGPHDPTEALLMQTAISRGVIVVAAMGNDYQRGNATSYPAALPDVIAVGASDESDRRGGFSQTGSHIHIMAPGTNILSTVPTYKVALTPQLDYDTWDGTSMATPYVTAAVALMIAKNPLANLQDVKNALANSAVKIGGQTGFTNDLGHGRLDLAEALRII